MDYDTKLLNLALDAGEIMLKYGGETHNVQDTMLRILSVSGREKIEAQALSTLILATLPREEQGPLSMVRGVKDRSVNFEKICAVNAMSRAFTSGEITLEEASQRLKEIHKTPAFKPITIIIGYGMNSGGFAMIFSQYFPDGIAGFFIGILLGIMMHWLGKFKTPTVLNVFLGGLLAAAVACLFHMVVPTSQTDMTITGSIMPLLPGLILTKSTRDYLAGDFISGNSKLAEALLIACAIAGGVALALSMFQSLL